MGCLLGVVVWLTTSSWFQIERLRYSQEGNLVRPKSYSLAAHVFSGQQGYFLCLVYCPTTPPEGIDSFTSRPRAYVSKSRYPALHDCEFEWGEAGQWPWRGWSSEDHRGTLFCSSCLKKLIRCCRGLIKGLQEPEGFTKTDARPEIGRFEACEELFEV